MSRGQWTSYDGFNLIELIEELKTRIKEPFRADDTLHGMLIVGKDYYGLIQELQDFLHRDDEKWLQDNKNIAEKLLQKVNSLDLKCICDSFLTKDKIYKVIAWDGGWKYGDLLIIDDNYEIKWYRREFFNCDDVDLRDVLYFKDHYKFNIKNYISEVK
jgi:hypothetical protein